VERYEGRNDLHGHKLKLGGNWEVTGYQVDTEWVQTGMIHD